MSVIVTDTGFSSEDWTHEFHSVEALEQEVGTPAFALDLASDTDPATLEGRLDGVDLIRVDFPSSADGRGFTIARALRRMGFAGRLRAKGHVIADQYAMARRCGFDEVEIDDSLASRQPEPQWLFRADWQAHDYQSRLRG
ncbi:MAG: DUF934 domain-containing protein [Celeribacter sp.]|jgi:uncharacterized protein (DUF934 family)